MSSNDNASTAGHRRRWSTRQMSWCTAQGLRALAAAAAVAASVTAASLPLLPEAYSTRVSAATTTAAVAVAVAGGGGPLHPTDSSFLGSGGGGVVSPMHMEVSGDRQQQQHQQQQQQQQTQRRRHRHFNGGSERLRMTLAFAAASTSPLSSASLPPLSSSLAARGVSSPRPSLSSAVVPPTSYLSQNRPSSRRVRLPGTPAGRYGGRARGSGAPQPRLRHPDGASGGRFSDSASSTKGSMRPATTTTAAATATAYRQGGGGENRRTLGFVVIDDADGVGSATATGAAAASSTRLEMVARTFDHDRESTDDVAAAAVDDAVIAGGKTSLSRRATASASVGMTSSSSSSSSLSSVSLPSSDRGIRTVSASTSSPLKKRVAESLLGSMRMYRPAAVSSSRATSSFTAAGDLVSMSSSSSSLSSSSSSSSSSTSPAPLPPLKVPAWFPWLPTREQINMLRGSELREACVERGLDKTGNKETLQLRLQEWTKQQHERRVLDRRMGLSSASRGGGGGGGGGGGNDGGGGGGSSSSTHSLLDDMIDEALHPGGQTRASKSRRGRAVSSSPSIRESDLFNRRREMRLSKHATGGVNGSASRGPNVDEDNGLSSEGEDSTSHTSYSTEENRAALAKVFNSPPAKYSNIEIKRMYKAAKLADQTGDRPLAREILSQLREATPNDSRILRRLARMEAEVGNVAGAREVLQCGIRRNPRDAHLLQGLAQIELKLGNADGARGLYKEAIRADPALPNPYHALGTLEHSRGNIRVATTVLRRGLQMCPTNHRLHHALGDLYREARMLDMAEREYRKALMHSPEWGRSFGLTALAFLSYERGDVMMCRKRLHEAVELNGGAHSQGWLALANLEESEGRIDDAREVYAEAAACYERRRIRRSFVRTKTEDEDDEVYVRGDNDYGRGVCTAAYNSGGTSSCSGSNNNKTVVRPSFSGDKWIFLYRSWARLEERYGSLESADGVYRRAAKVFRGNASILTDWAALHARNNRTRRARTLFRAATDRAGTDRAEPYRLSAEFEMSQCNYHGARSVLYRGAQALSESRDGGASGGVGGEGFARLYHTWAVCEWHLGNLDRAEVLFDRALRLTDSGRGGSEIRSLILYSIARFLYDSRGEDILAQHCVCLSLKENFLPGGNSRIWLLWAKIARSMKNEDLAGKCTDQARRLSEEEKESGSGGGAGLSRLLRLRDVGTGVEEESEEGVSLPMITGPAMQRMLRREPWHHKIAGAPRTDSCSWYEGVPFPELSEERMETAESTE